MKRREGMTLIELLIVLGVIAVIAGLVFSAMIQTRKRANLATCISNLRQLVLAVHAYEEDWGWVPMEYHIETPEGAYGHIQQLIYEYVRDDNVFICPEDYSKGSKDGGMGPVTWKGKLWRISYDYFINEVSLKEYNVTQTFPDMVLFSCIWHDKLDIIARYDGRIEIAPEGRYRSVGVITEP